jgi:hypothetical protein
MATLLLVCHNSKAGRTDGEVPTVTLNYDESRPFGHIHTGYREKKKPWLGGNESKRR